MILPRPSRALRAACLLALSGCATPREAAAPRAETLLTERPAPTGRQCMVSAVPAVLPAVDAVVDSAGLHADLASLAERRGISSGYALLSIGYDVNGWNAWRIVIDQTLPAGVADSVQALVFARRREVAPGSPWGARLRIDLAEGTRLRMGRQELCGARLLDPIGTVSVSGSYSVRERFTTGVPTSSVWVRVLVDERGGVASARPEYGGAGMRSETTLINYVQSLGFEPATVDGIPVASWTRVRVPVR